MKNYTETYFCIRLRISGLGRIKYRGVSNVSAKNVIAILKVNKLDSAFGIKLQNFPKRWKTFNIGRSLVPKAEAIRTELQPLNLPIKTCLYDIRSEVFSVREVGKHLFPIVPYFRPKSPSHGICSTLWANPRIAGR